jgi:hypothetical protein
VLGVPCSYISSIQRIGSGVIALACCLGLGVGFQFDALRMVLYRAGVAGGMSNVGFAGVSQMSGGWDRTCSSRVEKGSASFRFAEYRECRAGATAHVVLSLKRVREMCIYT